MKCGKNKEQENEVREKLCVGKTKCGENEVWENRSEGKMKCRKNECGKNEVCELLTTPVQRYACK